MFLGPIYTKYVRTFTVRNRISTSIDFNIKSHSINPNLTRQKTNQEIMKETLPLYVITSFDQYTDMSVRLSM